MNLNKVFLIGRLTRDPESRTMPSGQPVASFGLATDRFYTDKSGQKKQQTEFHNIVLFGRQAEIASQYLSKGAMAMIEGRLQTRSWKDNTGNTKYKTEIVGERMQLGPKSSGSANKSSFVSRDKDAPEPTREEEPQQAPEEIPVIEEGEIDVKDIPF